MDIKYYDVDGNRGLYNETEILELISRRTPVFGIKFPFIRTNLIRGHDHAKIGLWRYERAKHTLHWLDPGYEEAEQNKKTFYMYHL